MMYKLKLNYLSMLDVFKYEAWLNDMYQKGLELQKFVGIFAVFKKIKPSNLKFKLIHKEDKKYREDLETSNSFNLINSKSEFYVLSYTSSENMFIQIDEKRINSIISRTNKSYIVLFLLTFLMMLLSVFLTSWHPIYYFAPLLVVILEQIWCNNRISKKITGTSDTIESWKKDYYKYKIMFYLLIPYYLIFIYYAL